MAVSEYKHHTSQGQNMDRAGRGVRDAVHGEVPEALLPQEPSTEHFTLDDDDSVPELWGSRPERLFEVRPQERVQRRTVQQIVDIAPLPTLDDPVPQTVEQLVEVPTIVSFSSLQRIAEQSVDIPVVGGSGAGGGLSGFLSGQYYSVTAEQIVDNPVPRPGGPGGLQGLFTPWTEFNSVFGADRRVSRSRWRSSRFSASSVFFGFSWTSW